MNFNKFSFSAMPKGTPPEIIETFSAAMKRVVENPEFQEGAARLYITPKYMDEKEGLEYAAEIRDYFMQYQDTSRSQGK